MEFFVSVLAIYLKLKKVEVMKKIGGCITVALPTAVVMVRVLG